MDVRLRVVRCAVVALALGRPLLLPDALTAQVRDTGAWVALGVGYGSASGLPDTNFSTSVAGNYLAQSRLFTLRWVELRPILSDATAGDIAALYGRAHSAGVFRTSASVGVAYVYDGRGRRGLGLPVEGTIGASASDLGLEIAVLADLNGLNSFWGAQLQLVAGRLR
jgi:hypothetical protein